ncbi:mitochondrial sodium/calcium exchanger protein [Drosophila pseudoobscura]|uniref:Mitochondrial sodium/calcium exchanger protein n=1 Tax=Drosophila pseudoobscura pseudoobscura TaxID=46245 RepID=A0A6I8UVN3_DROPS|nr:mitochondrial sodium/calcium exchanger protein [Drosophila pseudoobscura]
MAESQDVEHNVMDEEFDEFWDKVSCYVVANFPYDERCDFVLNATDCITETIFVPYMRMLACDLKCRNQFQEIVYLTMFVAFCLQLLMCLTHVVDMYYSPALKVVSQMLHMNEHLAGVTLLAFGNTSPDLAANLAAIREEVPVFANSLAMALFVSMFTGGMICYISPFKMNTHGTVRDILFFILGVTLLEYVMASHGEVDMTECFVLVLVYISYIVVNILDVYLMRKAMIILERQIGELRDQQQTVEVRKKLGRLEVQYAEYAEDAMVEILERPGSRVSVVNPVHDKFTYTTKRTSRVRQSVNPLATRSVFYNLTTSRNSGLWRDFARTLNPIDIDEWRGANMFGRAFLLAMAPAKVLCATYIPLVDHELEKHGWSKLLNCIHTFLNPAITIIVSMALHTSHKKKLWYSELANTYIYGVYSCAITVPFAIFVFIHSRTDVPPVYHWVYTIMNLTGSIFLIFVCASEIDKLLGVVGNILNIEDDFMGVTVNAITQALGDLVANTAMAYQGYEKMAYAAAIGGPFFNVLLGTGAVMYFKLNIDMKVTIEEQSGEYGTNAYIFLNLGLFATLLWTSTLDFFARRSMGIFSIMIYLLFLLFAFLIHQNTIHSFASDPTVKPSLELD